MERQSHKTADPILAINSQGSTSFDSLALIPEEPECVQGKFDEPQDASRLEACRAGAHYTSER